MSFVRFVVLLSSVFFLNYFVFSLTPADRGRSKVFDQDVFKVLDLLCGTTRAVKEKGLREVDVTDFWTGALQAGLRTIDPHSGLILNYDQVSQSISGNFSGIGVSVVNKNIEDDLILVADVLDASPGQAAGILVGDKICEVNGKSLKGMSCEEVVSLIRGKRGTCVKLKLMRNKKVVDLEIQRDTITDQASVGYYFKDHGVFYISLKSFTENAPKQMTKLVQVINENSECKGLILDLRSNPGGVVDVAVEIASLFVPKNSLIVSTRNRNNQVLGQYKTCKEPCLKKNLTIFVLINNFTASAAELLAGALRHYSDELIKSDNQTKPQVFVLGTTSFGKGSVQEVIPLSKKVALKLTTMLYFLPDGSSVQARGVSPDFLIMPMRPLSVEEKLVYSLYGKEQSSHHHVTREEVDLVLQGKTTGKHSCFNETTSKKIQKLEEASRNQGLEFKGLEDYDFGDYLEKVDLLKPSKEAESLTAAELDSKRIKSLLQDHQVRNAVSMIGYLNLLQKVEKNLLDRPQAIKALSNAFLLQNQIRVEKVS